MFFTGERGSYGTHEVTKHMFNPLTGDLIILVCCMLEHAITEYEFGFRVMKKFEGVTIDSKYIQLDPRLCVLVQGWV